MILLRILGLAFDTRSAYNLKSMEISRTLMRDDRLMGTSRPSTCILLRALAARRQSTHRGLTTSQPSLETTKRRSSVREGVKPKTRSRLKEDLKDPAQIGAIGTAMERVPVGACASCPG